MRYLVELNNFETPSEKYEREKAEAEARGESHPAKKPRHDPEPEEDEEPSFGCRLSLSRLLQYTKGSTNDYRLYTQHNDDQMFSCLE